MKEIICSKCGKSTGVFRHDNHLIHKFNFMECKDCGKVIEECKKNTIEYREINQQKWYSEEEIRAAINVVAKKHGINTEGVIVFDNDEDEDGHFDTKTVACWGCALLKELGLIGD